MKSDWKQGPKPEDIKKIFGKNAEIYDLANDVISFRLARLWRKKLVLMSSFQKKNEFTRLSVLDCAAGTGDLAFEFKKKFPHIKVSACDFCKPMLEKAKKKAKNLNLDVDFYLEDITNLSFPSSSFDCVSIAYGIRNVVNPEKAIREMARVMRPGSLLLILETGDTRGMFAGSAIKMYFQWIVPLLGGWVSGDRKSYEYLSDSSRHFPCGKSFVSFLKSLNLFESVDFKKLFCGASFIYKAKLLS